MADNDLLFKSKVKEAIEHMQKGLQHLSCAKTMFLDLNLIDVQQAESVEEEIINAANTLSMLRDSPMFKTPEQDHVNDTETDDDEIDDDEIDDDEMSDNTTRSPLKPRKLTFKRQKKGDIDRRVQIKWVPDYVKEGEENDDVLEWFQGTVTRVRKNKNEGSHEVAYDDGTIKWEKKDALMRAKLWMFLD